MVRMKRKPQRLILLIIFFAALALFLNSGMALAGGGGAQGSGQESKEAGRRVPMKAAQRVLMGVNREKTAAQTSVIFSIASLTSLD
jgi:hypothetical protein